MNAKPQPVFPPTAVSDTRLVDTMNSLARTILKTPAHVWWYLTELMGDTAYAKYVTHLKAHHPDATVPTEREYWRARYAAQDANPGARCC